MTVTPQTRAYYAEEVESLRRRGWTVDLCENGGVWAVELSRRGVPSRLFIRPHLFDAISLAKHYADKEGK